MTYKHRQLAAGRWRNLSLAEQLANIGSEVERTMGWKQKNRPDLSQQALWRALELVDLTIDCQTKSYGLKELTRLREALVDYFAGNNSYHSSDYLWHRYFFGFNFAARAGK